MLIRSNSNRSGWRAFSRVDLVVTLGVSGFLLTWLGFGHLGERGRIMQCANNLRLQGQAMREYANDHGDGIPAAEINLGSIAVTWDELLKQYLNVRLANHTLRIYVCPSDVVPRQGVPRSYAMGRNDMLPEHWPPGRDSATGVGLCWNELTVRLLLANEAALKKPELLPPLKLSSVPIPSDTLSLTELVNAQNVLGGLQKATVSGVSRQQQYSADGGVQFHRGRFNYLMVDGHVETLSPFQTGAVDGSAGIWTLKKEK